MAATPPPIVSQDEHSVTLQGADGPISNQAYQNTFGQAPPSASPTPTVNPDTLEDDPNGIDPSQLPEGGINVVKQTPAAPYNAYAAQTPATPDNQPLSAVEQFGRTRLGRGLGALADVGEYIEDPIGKIAVPAVKSAGHWLLSSPEAEAAETDDKSPSEVLAPKGKTPDFKNNGAPVTGQEEPAEHAATSQALATTLPPAKKLSSGQTAAVNTAVQKSIDQTTQVLDQTELAKQLEQAGLDQAQIEVIKTRAKALEDHQKQYEQEYQKAIHSHDNDWNNASTGNRIGRILAGIFSFRRQ